MFLHIHQDNTDSLNVQNIAKEFVLKNQKRMEYFGDFRSPTLLISVVRLAVWIQVALLMLTTPTNKGRGSMADVYSQDLLARLVLDTATRKTAL